MKTIFINSFSAALAFTMMSAPAAAAPGQVALNGVVKAEKTVMVGGVAKVELSEPKTVLPGDHLLFATAYTNTGAQPVRNFVVTNPVPAAVSVASESAAALQVSVDRGVTWGRLAALTLPNAAGGRRPAQANDVTHVRWTIPAIAPGASGKVEYHAIVR